MNIDHSKLLLPVALLGIALLSGCSNAPSTSDAKQAVKNAIGDCKYVEVVDFEKVNGIASGESHYTLQVKYGLKISPPEANAKILADMNTQLSGPTPLVQWEKTELYSKTRGNIAGNLYRECPSLPRNILSDYASADIALFGDTIRIDYTNNNLQMIKSDNGWISQ